jgi:hypothetical protein
MPMLKDEDLKDKDLKDKDKDQLVTMTCDLS